MSLRSVVAIAVLAAVASACGATASDRATAPGADGCRNLTASDLDNHTNESPSVPCTKPHTAQTFFVGTFPDGTPFKGNQAGSYVYSVCNTEFANYLGADQSLAMRIQLSWAWFGPSEAGWKKGARWFRCDVVGGPVGATQLIALPSPLRQLFQGAASDKWLMCGRGADFSKKELVSCAGPHDWRAVGTVKLGQPDDPYPGDNASDARAKTFCSDFVGAWLNYALDYEFGYTYFHEGEWKAGNRRAICWAKTSK